MRIFRPSIFIGNNNNCLTLMNQGPFLRNIITAFVQIGVDLKQVTKKCSVASCPPPVNEFANKPI